MKIAGAIPRLATRQAGIVRLLVESLFYVLYGVFLKPYFLLSPIVKEVNQKNAF